MAQSSAKKSTKKAPQKRQRFQLETKFWVIGIVVFFALILVQILIPNRILVSVAVLLLFLSTAAMVAIILVFKDERYDFCLPPIFAVFLAAFLVSIARFFDYTFVGDPIAPFWLVSLPIGLAITVYTTVKWVVGKAKPWAVICFFIILLLIFFLAVEMYISHLNYALDFDEPTKINAPIIEKDYTFHSKGADTYEFKFMINGEEVWLEVGVVEYETNEIGDVYRFKQYKGAFGVEFYIDE